MAPADETITDFGGSSPRARFLFGRTGPLVLAIWFATTVPSLHLAPAGAASEADPAPHDRPDAGDDSASDGDRVATSRSRLQAPNLRASPDELFAFIDAIVDPAAAPTSRGRQRFHRRKVARFTVLAAEAILTKVPADDPAHARAITLKLDALETLKELGEPRVAEALAAFAETLVDHQDPAVATRARRLALDAEIDGVLASNDPAAAVSIVRRLAALLRESPDDASLLQTATSLARRLERMPGGDAPARLALETCLPFLEKSTDPRLQAAAVAAAGTLRRLSLPGRPIEIEGTLLDGRRFDPASLAGKVVLVDFWATWCGPCVAEIPHVLALHEKYHDRGFTVVGVSLDEDLDALEAFVAERELPWPILVDAQTPNGGTSLLATRYGISGIPTMILVGRDGNVISIEARGRRLEALVDELFAGR